MKKFTKILALTLVIAFSFALLAACAPSNYDDAETKMKDAGYTVLGGVDKNAEEGLVGGFIAGKGLLATDGMMIAALYDSSKSAKAAYDDMVKEDDEDYENLQRIGKWIVYGDEETIKEFKKL